jgi:hypothetical protein
MTRLDLDKVPPDVVKLAVQCLLGPVHLTDLVDGPDENFRTFLTQSGLSAKELSTAVDWALDYASAGQSDGEPERDD